MKTNLTILLIAFAMQTTLSQCILYQISASSSSTDFILSEFNSSNGISNELGSIPELLRFSDVEFDVSTNNIILYGAINNVDNFEVFVINPNDLSNIITYPVSNVDELFFGNNQMYFLSETQEGGQHILKTFDSNNGNVTTIDTIPDLIRYNNVVFDETNDKIILYGAINDVDNFELFVIDPNNLSSVTTYPISDVGGLVYGSGNIFFTQETVSGNRHILNSFNSTNGIVQEIDTIPELIRFVDPISFDPLTDQIIIYGAVGNSDNFEIITFSPNGNINITTYESDNVNELFFSGDCLTSINTVLFKDATLIPVFPNPVKDNLTINPENYLVNKVETYSSTGFKTEIEINNNSIDVSSLLNGNYILIIHTQKGEVLTSKFSKN